MKNAIIFHGLDCSITDFWYASVKECLESKQYSVWLPQLPEGKTFDSAVQVPYVLQQGTFTKDTILIGHSAGVPLILNVLQKLSVRVAKVILVAGLARVLDAGDEKFVPDNYDWERIRQQCAEFIIINSDNDPWGCTDKEGRFMFDHVGGVQIIVQGEGHFGSLSFNQPYKSFPLLEKFL